MVSGAPLFLGLFNNLAIFIVLIAVYGFLIKYYENSKWWTKQIALGCAFGFFAICCMYVKIPVAEGVIVDQRNAIVTLSGIFGGPISAVLCAACAGLYRIYLGGKGVLSGFIGVWLAAVAGMGLHGYPGLTANVWKAALGSFVATLIILPGFVFVGDFASGWALTKAMALPYGGAIFLGIYFVGLLLAREDRLHHIEILQKQYVERIRDFAESASDWFWEMDENGRIIFLSSRYEEITGLKIADQQGLRLWDREESIGKSERWNTLKADFAERKAFKDFEYDLTIHATKILHIRISGRPVFDETGHFIGYRGSATDFSKRKQEEEEREKLQSQLVQAQKMESIGRLAGGVAHDFNNMLGVIVGHTELALMKIQLSNPLHANLVEIDKAAQRSADLTRQLLAFARKQTVAPRVLDLNDSVGGMLKMLRRLIGEDIYLAWKPRSELWSIHIDPTQIDQILMNLCVNARDAIAGVGQITIETENVIFDDWFAADSIDLVPGAFVMLAVSDTGCGMSKDTQEKLFEPFFTTKEMGKGVGLGLATVYGILKQNNGFIKVYSEPGVGTTFKMFFPRYEGELSEIQREIHDHPFRGKGETVLLVEDEPMVLMLGKTMLETLGYRVLTSSTPRSAIRIGMEYTENIQLLITDVVMPEMNGRDLAVQMQSYNPKIKKVFMSGYTANVIVHQGVLDEGVFFLQKPFSMKSLSNKVREALDSSEV